VAAPLIRELGGHPLPVFCLLRVPASGLKALARFSQMREARKAADESVQGPPLTIEDGKRGV
jgi:hypothetical protein